MRLLAALPLLALLSLAAPTARADGARSGVAGSEEEEPKRPEEGTPLPEMTLATAEGQPVRVAGLHARGPLLLVFLHPTQRLSARLLRDLVEKLPVRPKAKPVLVFSGRSGGPTKEQALAEDRFRVLLDGDRSAHDALGVVALPTCYVVERSGVIAEVRRGFTVSLARELGERLDVLLGVISAEELARRRAGPADTASPEVRERRRQLRLARNCMRQGELREALAVLDGLVRSDPKDVDARAARAVTLHRLERPEAFKALEAVNLDAPDDAEVGLALAQECLARDQLDEAEGLVRRVLARDAGSGPAQFVLGDVLSKRGKWEEAARAYRAAATAGAHQD